MIALLIICLVLLIVGVFFVDKVGVRRYEKFYNKEEIDKNELLKLVKQRMYSYIVLLIFLFGSSMFLMLKFDIYFYKDIVLSSVFHCMFIVITLLYRYNYTLKRKLTHTL